MKQRVDFFDTAKGILILLVVIGHVFETGPVNQYVYSFHMPAFFMVSGIMMNYSSALKKPLHTAIMDKAYALLIPFLFFEVIGVLSNIMRFGVTLNVFGYATNTLMLYCNNGPDWFIWSLFVDEVMFLTIHKLIHNKYLVWAMTLGIGTFMAVNHNIYSTFGSTGIGFVFFTVGYYAKFLFDGKRKLAPVILSGIISLTCGMVNGKVDLGTWTFGNIFLYVISAFAGTFFVIQLSKYVSSRSLTHFGRNTLIILGTHQAINLPIKVWTGISEYSLLAGTVVFLGIMAVQIPIIYVFNTFIPFLVGKKDKGILIGKMMHTIEKTI